MRRAIVLLTALGLPTLALAQAPRRVFVLHSGVHIYYAHPDKDFAAKVLRRDLLARGVAARDVAILPSPFPAASKDDKFPRDGMLMFLDSSNPESKFSQDSYRRLHALLVKEGVGPDDRIVWIGHSAGGQVGMTMAYIASKLDAFPDLANATKRYRFDAVFALGTPMGADVTPDDVRLHCYCSQADKVVSLVCSFTPLLHVIGYRQTICPAPPRPRGNTIVRWFDAIEHPYWIHEDRVFDRIFDDLGVKPPPNWRREASVFPAMCLSQGLSQLLEDHCRVSLEDPPARVTIRPSKGAAPR